jgi:hypothetical protein
VVAAGEQGTALLQSVAALVSMVRVRVQQRWACEGEEEKSFFFSEFFLCRPDPPLSIRAMG